mmetsp:Transcript_7617/g.24382  ORF Transcript_7617/g.24382 Transcript_7617/m.24382 type:complete len:212 (+) Transcript_7617:1494-2129(+)
MDTKPAFARCSSRPSLTKEARPPLVPGDTPPASMYSCPFTTTRTCPSARHARRCSASFRLMTVPESDERSVFGATSRVVKRPSPAWGSVDGATKTRGEVVTGAAGRENVGCRVSGVLVEVTTGAAAARRPSAHRRSPSEGDSCGERYGRRKVSYRGDPTNHGTTTVTGVSARCGGYDGLGGGVVSTVHAVASLTSTSTAAAGASGGASGAV